MGRKPSQRTRTATNRLNYDKLAGKAQSSHQKEKTAKRHQVKLDAEERIKKEAERKAREMEDTTEYEIEKIVDANGYNWENTNEYLVKWKGYSSKDNTWEPAEDVEINADEAVDAYWETQPKRNHTTVRKDGTHNFAPYDIYATPKTKTPKKETPKKDMPKKETKSEEPDEGFKKEASTPKKSRTKKTSAPKKSTPKKSTTKPKRKIETDLESVASIDTDYDSMCSFVVYDSDGDDYYVPDYDDDNDEHQVRGY